MSVIENREQAERLLSALGEQLAAAGERFELVVIGGSGLLALGEIERSTRDVDLVALRDGDELSAARPLPDPLRRAAARVARDFGLDEAWLNDGPTSLLDFGVPEGSSCGWTAAAMARRSSSTSPRAMTRSTSSSTR
jgi:Nucleotidyltransferase of unknown function (DUF6036)